MKVGASGQKATTVINCLKESFGAVVNTCKSEVYTVFELPVNSSPSSTVYTLSVQNYADGTGKARANCVVWSFDGLGHGEAGTNATFNAIGAQTLEFTSVAFGNAISLHCYIPVNEGIASITW